MARQIWKMKMVGLPFRRGIQITQNTIRLPKRKAKAFKSGSNQMADARLAVGVRGKIEGKCLVMRLKFVFIREFYFPKDILNQRIKAKTCVF